MYSQMLVEGREEEIHVGAVHMHGVIYGRLCVLKSIVMRWFGGMRSL